MKQKCKICGANAESELCFRHKSKKALKSSIIKQSLNVKNKNNELKIMQTLFLSIWNKRPHKSEVSEEKIYGEPLSIYFHHILSKKKHPETCLDEENIIILTADEHSNVESDMYKYEEINKRREYLKIKYNINY